MLNLQPIASYTHATYLRAYPASYSWTSTGGPPVTQRGSYITGNGGILTHVLCEVIVQLVYQSTSGST